MKASAPQAGPSARRWLLLVPILGGTCLVLVAIVLVVILAVRSISSSDGEPNPGIPLEVTRATSVAGAATPTPGEGGPVQTCDTVISSGDAQQPVSLPVSLTVDSQVFPVVVTVPAAGVWSYPEGHPGGAAWVCGTVVNYLVQLEATPASQALLDGLLPGSSLALRLSNGTSLLFRFAERREVKAYDPATLVQSHPRLTLIVPLEGEAWKIATAEYAAEAEAPEPLNTLAQLNQAVQVGDARVTVSRGYTLRQGLALQPGTMAYIVEFSIENTGTEPINADVLVMELQDGAGNSYLRSPEASLAGERGPLSGQVAPGASMPASAGYIVPETLAGPTLIWTFAPGAGSQLQASIGIPFEGGLAATSTGQFEAAVTDAFITSDGQTIVIEGEIRNVGQTPVTIDLRQVSLTSSAGLSILRLAAPPLPWTIAPGQTQVIELQYARPAAPAALLALAGYSFEIQGID